MAKKCKICKKTIVGRSDKLFCSFRCKNYYHINLRKVTDAAVENINKILHRNRAILLEIMGKNSHQKKVPRTVLDKKKFNYIYHTHTYTNQKGKTYHFVYDFSWMEFSDDEILIVRKKM